ncbi:hypothetical protein AB0B63_18655 [Micromonospora sp. NPDC049081]|uniref:hypothetical protein n=1 Tax=Micromonospora sp. NPDC049081 TaxID=3155150 RepID=UPI00340E80A1
MTGPALVLTRGAGRPPVVVPIAPGDMAEARQRQLAWLRLESVRAGHRTVSIVPAEDGDR